MPETLTTASGLQFTVQDVEWIAEEQQVGVFSGIVVGNTIRFDDYMDAYEAMPCHLWEQMLAALTEPAREEYEARMAMQASQDADFNAWRNR